MAPLESTSPWLIRLLSEKEAYPEPRLVVPAVHGILVVGGAALTGFVLMGWPVPGILTGLAASGSSILLTLHHERNLPAGIRRHRAAHKVLDRLKGLMNARTLHRTLDPGLLALMDEGAKQYLLARGHAAKVSHALTAQADAAAVAAMDDLLLEIGLTLPSKIRPRSFGDAMADTFAIQPMNPIAPIGAGIGRFFGATTPPEPDYDAMRRVRPHVQALANLATEIERTLPSLVQTLDLPGGEPPISKTLDALREHREARESLERELRLGG